MPARARFKSTSEAAGSLHGVSPAGPLQGKEPAVTEAPAGADRAPGGRAAQRLDPRSGKAPAAAAASPSSILRRRPPDFPQLGRIRGEERRGSPASPPARQAARRRAEMAARLRAPSERPLSAREAARPLGAARVAAGPARAPDTASCRRGRGGARGRSQPIGGQRAP